MSEQKPPDCTVSLRGGVYTRDALQAEVLRAFAAAGHKAPRLLWGSGVPGLADDLGLRSPRPSERITEAEVKATFGDRGVLSGTPQPVLIEIARLIEDWRRLRGLIVGLSGSLDELHTAVDQMVECVPLVKDPALKRAAQIGSDAALGYLAKNAPAFFAEARAIREEQGR